MKKEYDLEKLIELAKKAKPVPVEVHEVRKRTVHKNSGNSVLDFVRAAGIKRGRNEVDSQLLYNAYSHFAADPVSAQVFNREMQKILHLDGVNYKSNMKIITIEEKLKEYKNDSQKES